MHAYRAESCVICQTPFVRWRNRRTCDNAACVFAYQEHLRAGRATCSECGRPLSAPGESRGMQLCGDVRCQVNSRLNDALADTKRCSVCRVRLTPDCLADGVCREQDCREVARWQRQNALTNGRHAEFVEQTKLATQLRDQLAKTQGITAGDEFFVTVVSSFNGRLGLLPNERREAFIARIRSLVDELRGTFIEEADLPGGSEALPVAEPASALGQPTERLIGAVCAACGGFCCRNGDTHAYLQLDTLRRFLRHRRDVTLDQVADLYTACLPERSYEGSCVFHGETGCTLSRELRSDTCNTHYCAGQHSLRAALAEGAPTRAFVAKCDGSKVVAGRFLEAPR